MTAGATPYVLHHLLRAAAESGPDRVAVVDRERQLTYGQLEVRSNQLAHLLVQHGVDRGDRVGLYLDKSMEAIVAIYGVLKAGGVYVPLDPQAPTARLGYIARNCGFRCLLTGVEKAGSWAALLAAGAPFDTLIVLNDTVASLSRPAPGVRLLGTDELDASSRVTAPTTRTSLDLAYILYTSGSTGDPKGVMLSHRNALSFVAWAGEEFGVGAQDRLSGHAPLHFDLSIFDIFAAAYGSATLVLVPPKTSVLPTEVARFIDRQRISVWYSVPSVLSMLTQRGGLSMGAFPTLRTILFAGEVFPTKYLRQLTRLLPHVRFTNLYGPTETNVCTYYDVPPLADDTDEPIPIGRAIADVEVFAVTAEGRRAGPGEIGDLHVRGPTVMQGYWGDDERTRRSLVPNPFGALVDDPVYRTGDLVRRDGDGDYHFLGRRDAQIKSRGYRIELGDIEAALYAHPSVIRCAAFAVPDDLVTNRIRASAVVKDGTLEAELTSFCWSRLPRYMVPETIDLRDSLPETSTGKVDRQALVRAALAGDEPRRPAAKTKETADG